MNYLKNQDEILGHYAQYKPAQVKNESENTEKSTEPEQKIAAPPQPTNQNKMLPAIHPSQVRFSTYSTAEEAIPVTMKKTPISVYQHPLITLYHLSNYSLTQKDPQPEKDRAVVDRLLRMEQKYKQLGMKRSVDGVVLVHQMGHPHVLLLQIGTNAKGFYKLPGGRCAPGENEIDCLKRKLTKRLGIPNKTNNWKIGECISTWYRPAFETFMYPYLPAHITKPKECKKLFVVHLPEKCDLCVPKNFQLVAVPFYDLYENSKRYGPTISAIPQCVSRFQLNFEAVESQK